MSEIKILRFSNFNSIKTLFPNKMWFVYETEDKYVVRIGVENIFIAVFEHIKGDAQLDFIFSQELKRGNVIHVEIPIDIKEDIEDTIIEEELNDDLQEEEQETEESEDLRVDA